MYTACIQNMMVIKTTISLEIEIKEKFTFMWMWFDLLLYVIIKNYALLEKKLMLNFIKQIGTSHSQVMGSILLLDPP